VGWRKWYLTPFLSCLAAALLTGCGFHIRSVVDFPPGMSSVYIDTSNRHSPFYRELTTTIRESDLKLETAPEQADTIIRVLTDDTGQRPLTVSARNVPREYEIYYLVSYSVSIDGQEVLPPQRLVLIRDYTYDETKVLGKAREEDVLREAIAADLVGLLVHQVSAIR
jgi:LPS-assembly lipoprotein